MFYFIHNYPLDHRLIVGEVVQILNDDKDGTKTKNDYNLKLYKKNTAINYERVERLSVK